MYPCQVRCQAIRQPRHGMSLKWSEDYSGTRMCRNLACSWATANIQSWRLTLWRLDCCGNGLGNWTVHNEVCKPTPEQRLGTSCPKLQTSQSQKYVYWVLFAVVCVSKAQKKIHKDVDRERTQSWLSFHSGRYIKRSDTSDTLNLIQQLTLLLFHCTSFIHNPEHTEQNWTLQAASVLLCHIDAVWMLSKNNQHMVWVQICFPHPRAPLISTFCLALSHTHTLYQMRIPLNLDPGS